MQITRTAVVTAALLAGAAALGACSTDNDVVRGAAIGAAGGAAVGAVTPGVSTVEGAAFGAAGGAVIGAVTDDKDDERRKCAERYGYDTPAYHDCIDDD